MKKKGGKKGWELHDSRQESGGKPPRREKETERERGV